MPRHPADAGEITISLHLEPSVSRALDVYAALSKETKKSIINDAIRRLLTVRGVDDYAVVGDILLGRR